jgi:mRNA-degrading endonuclease RelE of RelBE toxin-antitoxin system
MDKIQKALRSLTAKERTLLESLLRKLASNDTAGLNIQKLKGHDDIFRLRKRDLRLIFRRSAGDLYLLAIERRAEKKYRDYR